MFLPIRENSGRILERESGGAMPDRAAMTIKDLIYYQYCRIIAQRVARPGRSYLLIYGHPQSCSVLLRELRGMEK